MQVEKIEAKQTEPKQPQPAIEALDESHHLIKELIESYREEWQRKQGQRDKQPRHHFYVSDVAKCEREIYYHFHAPEHKRTIADKTIIFNNGGLGLQGL